MSHFPVKEKWDFFKPSHELLHQTTTMNGILDSIGSAITTVSDFVCGYPLFILLIGEDFSCSFIPELCPSAASDIR